MSKPRRTTDPLYRDATAPIDDRVNDLISRMTLEQKVSQLYNSAKPTETAKGSGACWGWGKRYLTPGAEPVCLCWTTAVEELGIPAYEWWNECLHGCSSSWTATVFPQAIGMAASWNVDLLHRVAVAISDEARAKHHENLRSGAIEPHTGLTYWSPVINIFRDPRWGRGQETYGEDPSLTGRLGVAFVRGLQGDHPRYLKTVATPKHLAVHSGPEKLRHIFDARVSERDLRETYLPAFETCIKEGQAASAMPTYNMVNGESCSASKTLLTGILREEWGFGGYVVSDCDSIKNVHQFHGVAETPVEAAALALQTGCDLNCGTTYRALTEALGKGLISERDIDQALRRTLTGRFRLGMFDPPEMVPYAQIPASVIDSQEHRELAREVARQAIVLLKNEDSLLPLSRTLRSIAVIGPNADSVDALLGNYNGSPSSVVTVLEGIKRAVSPGTEVVHAAGCDLGADALTPDSLDHFNRAVAVATQADIAVLVLGLSTALEGEENQAWDSRIGDDRSRLDLPGVQADLLKAVHATGTPVVVVLMTGSAVAVNWADQHVPAILNAWYGGEEGGSAVADVLFGDYSPAGRLPVTFYKSVDQLPPFTDYSMANRTYRYFKGEPLYPFGYGLSYTEFRYSDLTVTPPQAQAGDDITVGVTVQNVGGRAGDEVVQLYVADAAASHPVPIRSLQGFGRIHLNVGEQTMVQFVLTPRQMSLVDDLGRRVIEPGEFIVTVGGGQPDALGTEEGRNLLTGSFKLTGKVISVK